jgi:acetolactate synthase small subunit
VQIREIEKRKNNLKYVRIAEKNMYDINVQNIVLKSAKKPNETNNKMKTIRKLEEF